MINVVKRNGAVDALDIEKIHRIVSFACEGIEGVSVSEVVLRAKLEFADKIKTKKIQETLIKSATNLISLDTPNYQFVAGRLLMYDLRKEVYGDFAPPSLYSHTKNLVELGFYTSELMNWYSEDEFNEMETFLNHDKDMGLTFASVRQFADKYLVKDKSTGKIYETPQFAYILISATLFYSYPKDTRMKYIKDYYEFISDGAISIPTPVISGVRTTDKQFSSCVLITAGDDRKEISTAGAAIIDYVSNKAGIGLNVGMIRGLGAKIRNGATTHTGIIPFLKFFRSATKSCSQGAIRDGSATFNYPVWHYEVEDLLVLKNNKGIEDNRIRDVDYVVQINGYLYQKMINNDDVFLLDPNCIDGLYDAFFQDQDKFIELYEQAVANPNIRKKKISGRDLFNSIVTERLETGRLYIMNIDKINAHSSFDPNSTTGVRMTNLCCEITLSDVKPLKSLDDPEGRIALCTLSAINMAKVNKTTDFKKLCEMAIRGLDALLSYQDYPVLAAELHTKEYRTLGLGITNLAYWLAKNNLTYGSDKESLEMFHEYMEAFSYYSIKASIKLAKEFGACEKSCNTRYSQGILPIDTYSKAIDEDIINPEYKKDWESLRGDLKKYGIRNATLMAQMPCESSSLTINSTNGIEPIISYIQDKISKSGLIRMVVPEYEKYGNRYDMMWDQPDCEGYLKMVAIMQKFIDQAISTSTFYNPSNYERDKISIKDMKKHILLAYRWGISTLYYARVNPVHKDGSTDDVVITNTKTVDRKLSLFKRFLNKFKKKEIIVNKTIDNDDNVVVEYEDEAQGCAGGACTL
jgi:ribonucleoside-diphosphate reductase alpha chain